jgi:hypothetical protein
MGLTGTRLHYRRGNMISETETWIEVCVCGAPPFVCAVNGRVTVECIVEIEKQLTVEDAEVMSDGTYLYKASFEQGDETFESYWDLTLETYTPLPDFGEELAKEQEADRYNGV